MDVVEELGFNDVDEDWVVEETFVLGLIVVEETFVLGFIVVEGLLVRLEDIAVLALVVVAVFVVCLVVVVDCVVGMSVCIVWGIIVFEQTLLNIKNNFFFKLIIFYSIPACEGTILNSVWVTT